MDLPIKHWSRHAHIWWDSVSTPEIMYRKHRASCRHIGNTQKQLVVNTNEWLSECDGTPCSLHCQLTLGEDSPGSLAQRKPGDKLDAIHHSPTPAPELLVPSTPHPPKQTHPSSATHSEFIFRARTAAARGRVSAWGIWNSHLCMWGADWKRQAVFTLNFSAIYGQKHRMWLLRS